MSKLESLETLNRCVIIDGVPRTKVTALGVMMTLCVDISAQTPPQRFEARADVVIADLIILDKRGDPLRDLRLNELRLNVDGKTRAIESLDLVEMSGASLVASPGSSPIPLAPPSTPSSTGRDRSATTVRNVFFLFDESATRPGDERQSVDGAITFLSMISPNDKAAVRTLPFGRIMSDLTTDRQATIDSLRFVKGALPPPPPPDAQALLEQRACDDYQRTKRTLSELNDFLTGLTQVSGPKIVVLVSSGLLPFGSEQPLSGHPGCVVTSVDAQNYRDVGTLASVARAQFFVIQPHSFMIEAGSGRAEPVFLGFEGYHAYLDSQLQGLQTVSTITGGELFLSSGMTDKIFETIGRETAAYYLVGFRASDGDRDGKPHKIAFSTTRRDVTIRARPTFRISR